MPTLTPEQQSALQEASKRGMLTPEQQSAANEYFKRQGIPMQGQETRFLQATRDSENNRVVPEEGARDFTALVTQAPDSTFGSVATQTVAGFNEGVIANLGGMPVDLINAGLGALGLEIEKPLMGSQFIKENILSPFDPGKPKTDLEKSARDVGTVAGETAGVGAGMLKAGQGILNASKVATQNPEGWARVTDIFKTVIGQMAQTDPAKLKLVERTLRTGTAFKNMTTIERARAMAKATSGLMAGQTALKLGAETALGGIGGIGGELFEKAFGDKIDPETANFYGQLVTNIGVQATLGLLNLAGRYARHKLFGLTEAEIQEEVGKKLTRAAGSPEEVERTIGRIEEAQGLSEEFPGFEPSLGQASSNEGLQISEKSLGTREARTAQLQREQTKKSRTAVRDDLESLTPGSQADVEEFRQTLTTERQQRQATVEREELLANQRAMQAGADVTQETKDIANSMDMRVQAAELRVQERLAAAPQSVDRDQLGEIIRQEYQKELGEFRASASGIYDQIDPANLTVIPGENSLASAIRVRDGQTKMGRPEDIPTEQINLIIKGIGEDVPPGSLTFHEMRDLRKNLLSAEREATRNGKDALAQNLNRLLDGVEADLDELLTNPRFMEEFPDIVNRYREASSFYRRGRARLYDSTVGRMRLRSGDRWITPNQKIPELFLRGEVELNDFVQAMGGRFGAMDALRTTARNDFYTLAIDPVTRQLDVSKAEKWVQQAERRGIFRAFPELQREFTEVTSQKRLLDEVRRQAKKVEADPERFGRQLGSRAQPERDVAQMEAVEAARVAKQTKAELDKSSVYLFVGEDADLAARRVFNSQSRIAETKAVMEKIKQDPGAVRGFQRAMWDEMVLRFEARTLDSIDRPALQSGNMKAFLDRNEPLMRVLFGDARVNRMRQHQKSMALLESQAKPASSGSDTATKIQGAMLDWGPFLSRMYAGPLGRKLVSGKWIVSERILRTLSKHFATLEEKHVQAILEEAFFDPEIGKTLMIASHVGVSPKYVAKRLQAHLVSLGLVPEQEAQ